MTNENTTHPDKPCVFMMHVHLVFLIKYRRDVLTPEILDDVRAIFSGVCADFKAELKEFEGQDDHVHLLVNYLPNVAVSDLVKSLKGVSSHIVRRKKYPSIKKKMWSGALWAPSHFAGSCGGASTQAIQQYIEQQHAS